jgi:oligopeptide/dipeptide ABC transporter ATP-binding protein
MANHLIEVEDLTVQYETASGRLTAVSDASFAIEEGSYFGLVGESGCGKSTIAKAILGGLDENGLVESGKIRFKGEEIQNYTDNEFNKNLRWKEISYIPQSSMNSLDPLQKLSEQAIQIGKTHTDMSEAEILDRFTEIFDVVGLQESRINDYPHEFSGGMSQRAIIALALFLEPSIIIADEPTTALDVIMQDQIFKYLDEIQDDLNQGMMLITHDISVVLESCDSMAIMHGGQIAETGTVEDLFDEPRHPYSILLQRAFPDVRYPDRELSIIEGTPPQSVGGITRCTFADRCPWAIEECRQAAPPLESIESETRGGKAACFRKDEIYRMPEVTNPAESGDIYPE